MANPLTVTTRPQYINANTLTYNAWDLRRAMDADPPGPGVFGYEDFRVLPRQAGANLSVDVGKTAVGLMQAWVRGSTRGAQGLYRVDNVDTTAPTADTYLAQLNVDVTSNGSGNPRLDMVVLEVLDQQHTGSSNLAQLRVIAGTTTPGATLDNRSGAAALPASCILLADILLASGDATVDAVDIRDRRQYPLFGAVPAILTLINQVTFQPHPAMVAPGTNVTIVSSASLDNLQSAALMFLPRGITGATRLRWRYTQGGTANSGSWNIGIADASGRVLVSTGAVAYTGAANSVQSVSATIGATTLEPGWYYVVYGGGVSTGGSTALAVASQLSQTGGSTSNVSPPNVALRSASGGTTMPTTILAFTDVSAATATQVNAPAPMITLSVG